MAENTQRAQVADLAAKGASDDAGIPARSGAKRGTRADALAVIFETAVRDGEGFRHGALGAPRFGKTYHMKEVATEAEARGLSELLFVHDCKRLDVQYDAWGPEVVRVDVADLQANPMAEDDPPVVVFHGNPAEGRKCSVEDVAALGLQQGRQGTATLVLIDELYHGMKARMTWEGKSFPEILREGSSQRVSSAWTTQIPQALPTEALDLTETVALFYLQRRSLRYAVDMLELEPDAVAAVQSLQRGEFILITADGWNGVIYGPK
jgi:hypothetical protein